MATPSRAAGWRTFNTGMFLYAFLVIAASFVVNRTDPGTGVRVALALAPAGAFLWGMHGWLNALRRLDELGRRIHVEAATITLAVIVAASLTYGLLQAYVGVPAPHAFVVFGVGGLTYALGTLISTRRYH